MRLTIEEITALQKAILRYCATGDLVVKNDLTDEYMTDLHCKLEFERRDLEDEESKLPHEQTK